MVNDLYRELADRFGTPLYIYDAGGLEDSFTQARDVVGEDTPIYYSLKSNPNISVYAVLRGCGARAEVSSLAELQTVLSVGTPADEILFLGPGKSREEIRACVEGGVRLVVESLDELDLVDEEAGRVGVRQDVLLRVNPAFQVKGSGLTMGGAPRQFGIDESVLIQPLDLANRHRHVRVMGVHAYMGTRILTASSIVSNTHEILRLAQRVAQAQEFQLELVDVGGGWGVAYFDGETPLDLDELRAGMRPVLEEFRRVHPHTVVATELGRFLSGPCGTYLIQVRFTKESYGQSFAVADGGTNHHMAAVGIGSFVKRNFPVELVGRPAEGPTGEWTISGPLCTPNDTLLRKVALPALTAGDLLAVRRSGAYGASASPGLFLSHGFPAEVMVRGGRAELVADAQTPEEILGRQHLTTLIHPSTTPTDPDKEQPC